MSRPKQKLIIMQVKTRYNNNIHYSHQLDKTAGWTHLEQNIFVFRRSLNDGLGWERKCLLHIPIVENIEVTQQNGRRAAVLPVCGGPATPASVLNDSTGQSAGSPQLLSGLGLYQQLKSFKDQLRHIFFSSLIHFLLCSRAPIKPCRCLRHHRWVSVSQSSTSAAVREGTCRESLWQRRDSHFMDLSVSVAKEHLY